MLEGNFLRISQQAACTQETRALQNRAEKSGCSGQQGKRAAAGSLEASGSFPTALAFGCWEPGDWEPFSALSSTALLQTDLTEPRPPSWTARRSCSDLSTAGSLLSQGRLEEGQPLVLGLAVLFRPALHAHAGERRLAMEELRTCLLSALPSPALAWLTRAGSWVWSWR